MSAPDQGHRLTDAALADLEARIAGVYGQAAREMSQVVADYFAQFAKQDQAQQQKLQKGEITQQYYTQWRLAQMGRGKRFQALADRLAARMTDANQVAAAYINDATPGIYSLNRNFAAYTIEQQVGRDIGFDLWDEQTVKRLIVKEPDLMPWYPPKRAINRGIDLAYGKQQITNQVRTGILMGESIPKLTQRIQQNIPTMSRASAIRAARTAVTAAQNGGRQESYRAATEMGIQLQKQWLATLDMKTRPTHGAADGQTVPEDKPFTVGGYQLMYPGDPKGPPAEVYNCRCTTIAVVEGVQLPPRMTYSEWLEGKRQDGKVYLQNQGNSDTIDLIPITDKTVETIPLLSPDGWKEKESQKLKEANQALLKAVQDKALGTEAGQIFDMQMSPLSSLIVGENAQQSVHLPKADTPYVAIHNHPDGLTFSEKDVETFIFDYDMKVIEAVGNNGKVYLLQKTGQYQAAKFIRAYGEQSKRLTQSQTPQQYADEMNQILKEAEAYGVRFITRG